MTLSIQIPKEMEKRLQEEARRQGVDPAEYASRLVQKHLPDSPQGQPEMDFDRALDEFFAANPEKLPALSPTMSREDLYDDHD